MRTYIWDFFGPDAGGTARHFAHHVDELLESRQIKGCESGHAEGTPVHFVAFLKTPSEHHEFVEKTLRPRRWVDE